jgi:hypothetical protein
MGLNPSQALRAIPCRPAHPPDSRRVAFRGPLSEGFCRMPRFLNRDFVPVSIPQQPVKKHHSPAPRLSKETLELSYERRLIGVEPSLGLRAA